MLNLSMREYLNCSKEEKQSCIPLINEIVGLSEAARREGLLALESDKYKSKLSILLRAGIELIIDGNEKQVIYDCLNDLIVMSGKTGVELLQQYICMTGLLYIREGYNPAIIRKRLAMMLGEDIYEEAMKTLSAENSFDAEKYTYSRLKNKTRKKLSNDLSAFEFEDISELDDSTIQRMLRDIAPGKLELALKSCPDEVRHTIYSNMTPRLVKMIEDGIECLSSTQANDIKAARQEIVNVVLRLAHEGQIAFPVSD